MKTQKILFSLLILGLLILPGITGAAGAGIDTIVNTINNVVDMVIVVLLAICTLMVLYGGIVMLMSQGDPTKVSNGRQIILWAAVGYVVAALAKAIAAIIASAID